MAQSKNNILMQGASGTIARQITFRQKAGKTIISKLRGPSTGQPTSGQVSVRKKFTAGAVYAKAAIADPAMKAAYAAVAQPGQSAYNKALADAFIPPTVVAIDKDGYHGAAGNSITVKATDDFKVKGVKVTIHNAAGDLLEQGDALAQVNGLDWIYTCTQVNATVAGSKITATATDLPGNSTSLDVTL